MTDKATYVRAYLEMAEAAHPGPLRVFAREVEAYLEELRKLVGRDELVCAVCGARNYSESGVRSALSFFAWKDGTVLCEAHMPAVAAHAERAE